MALAELPMLILDLPFGSVNRRIRRLQQAVSVDRCKRRAVYSRQSHQDHRHARICNPNHRRILTFAGMAWLLSSVLYIAGGCASSGSDSAK